MKWFFTDFDGTLRNSCTSKLEIIQTDLDFVKNLQAENNKLIIATGRPYKSIRQHIETKYENLKPDYYICNAGATINDHNGEVLYYSKFDKLQQDLITKKLIEIQNEITAVIYATPTEEEMLFDKEWNDQKATLFMDMTPQEKPLELLFNKTLICYKVLCNDTVWKKITNWLDEQNIKVNLTSNNIEGLTFSEIHPDGINKGNAIRVLQSQVKFADKDVIVAGDDNNDISMFKEFYNNSSVCKV